MRGLLEITTLQNVIETWELLVSYEFTNTWYLFLSFLVTTLYWQKTTTKVMQSFLIIKQIFKTNSHSFEQNKIIAEFIAAIFNKHWKNYLHFYQVYQRLICIYSYTYIFIYIYIHIVYIYIIFVYILKRKYGL